MSRTSLAKLRQEIERSIKQRNKLENSISKLDWTIGRNVKARDDLKSKLRGAETKLKMLRELVILESGLPKDILFLRAKVLAKKLQSKRTDITVAKVKTLEKNAK